jgi:hypothetical protein
MSDNHHASSVEKQHAQVSTLVSSLPNFPNTVIPKDMLVNHPSSWQAHLERISDFILLGKGLWWDECENGDILFFDAKGSPESLEKGPLLHHFRSSSFKSEESYLKKCWLKCVEQRSDLLILRLQIEDTNGNMVVHQHSASGGLIWPQSVEGVPDDELICNVGADDELICNVGAFWSCRS